MFFLRKNYVSRVTEKLHVSSASPGQIDEPISLFHFVANGFHEFENNCFRRKNKS